MSHLREGRELDVTVEQLKLPIDAVDVPVVHARPDGMPRAGVVLHPDIGGLRPLFDDMDRPATERHLLPRESTLPLARARSGPVSATRPKVDNRDPRALLAARLTEDHRARVYPSACGTAVPYPRVRPS